ncbi:MAG: GNAT family N-acetyltransferase [Pseudonocardiaceae bacterium]|nr:GNAT family N-acetyltransferase [Pseudonocardiaceae bacterium]
MGARRAVRVRPLATGADRERAPGELDPGHGRPVTVHIGPLGPEHAGEALTVQRAAYVTEAQRYDAPHIPPLIETVAELRADLSAGMLAFGAWLGHRLAGCVRGRVDGDRMEVARFVVAPDLQGRGIGRRLLAAVESAAPARVGTFWLVTGATSEENLRLYRGAGYQVAAHTTDPVGVALVVLEKPRPDRTEPPDTGSVQEPG